VRNTDEPYRGVVVTPLFIFRKYVHKVRVFYTSKPYVDYVYVARKDVSEAEREKFTTALLRLKKGENDDVLKILRASRFIRASDEEYDPVRQVAHELKMF
jgi:phosphonate transport system substrate-binding protein